MSFRFSVSSWWFALVALALLPGPAAAGEDPWQQRHDALVARLRALANSDARFGSAYQPLYRAALPWYELWGGRDRDPVDPWMVAPEVYAEQLAAAVEQGRNFLAEHAGALLPLALPVPQPNGRTVTPNLWLTIPPGFGESGRTFPLLIHLHGSGWLGHKISFVPKSQASAGMFEVTPINPNGPWSLEFLNACLDELQRILPIDPDRIYLEGHSLGAIGTWQWAMSNPERFAAISPRSGIGEPYRASRLRNVPVWVVHGERDDVVPSGCSDEMVSALQACGGRVRYSLLAGVGHNLPPELDEAPCRAWYLQQVRSHEPAPPDPRDRIALAQDGYSPWEVVALPERWCWRSADVERDVASTRDNVLRAVLALFDRSRAFGGIDAPVRERMSRASRTESLWLDAPRLLLPPGVPADGVRCGPRKVVRFHGTGAVDRVWRHVDEIEPAVRAAGYAMADDLWITRLSALPDAPDSLVEYWVELRAE